MITFVSALLIASCTTTIEPTPENKDFSIIKGVNIKTDVFSDFQKAEMQQPNAKNYVSVGDTVIIYRVPKQNTVSGTAPNLNVLKNGTNTNTPVRYVAMGGSLTAGVRDGGYFNEGIQTSYPNLIARQMQISFNQPYFADTEFNGFGRKVPTGNNPTGGPVQKFNIVKNNTGVESVSGTNLTLKKYTGAEIDNFGMPYLNRGLLRPKGTINNYLTYDKSFAKDIVTRVFNQNDSYVGKIFSKKPDIVTFELRTTEILNNLLGGNDMIGQFIKESKVFEQKPYQQEIFGTDLDMTTELELLRFFEDGKIKNGILLNVPDFITCPYFNSVTSEMIKSVGLDKSLSIKISTSNNVTQSGYFDISTSNLLPTTAVDSLLSFKISPLLKRGLNNNRPLIISTDVVSKKAFSQTVNNFNTEIELFSKRFNYPIVDIKGLYEKVIKGTFVSNDGLAVTSKDFFSTDGIYPSALGQACIANEVIKVMNTTYKTTIPLINIKAFK